MSAGEQVQAPAAPRDPRKNYKPHPTPTPFSEHVYATKHGKELLLRVWPSAQATELSPWILWAHGGGWTFGAHVRPNPWIIPSFRERGYHVVSWAYRYTPHVGIEDIVEDGKDAYAWSRANLPGLVDGKVDVDRAIVGGQSAGGNISTLLGCHLSPSPRAVIDVYGPIDFTDPHFISLDASQHRDFKSFEDRYTEEQVAAAVADRNISEALSIAPGPHELENVPIEDLRESWVMPNITYTDDYYLHGDVMRYMAAKKGLIRTLLRAERFNTEEDFIAFAKEWSPYFLVDKKGTYPPTWILHGEQDSSVPIAQARRFESKLKSLGVPVGTSYEEGDHLHDFKYTGPDVPGWKENIEPVIAFIEKHARA